MKVLLADSPYWEELGDKFQRQYLRTIRSAHKKVAKLLPFGSKHISFVVQPREYWLIDKTHDYGRTINSGIIELAFDPKYANKHPEQILEQATATVFHEMSHAARFNIPISHESFLDYCVLEGLASVFARDYAGYDAPWAAYPKDAGKWAQEIKKKGKRVVYGEYMYTHPDGRRWIGYKTGTYIIDQAMNNSGKTVIELTKLECADILKLARVI